MIDIMIGRYLQIGRYTQAIRRWGCLAMVMLCASAWPFAAQAQSETLAPVTCLWHAGHPDQKTLHQVATDTNTVKHSVSLDKVSFLAMNGTDCGVWAVADKQLYKLDANAVPLWNIPLKMLGEQHQDISQVIVDAFDNSIWLTDHKSLIQIDSSGKLNASLDLPANISTFAIALDQSLWALGENTLWHYSAKGQLLSFQELHKLIDDSPNLLAVDDFGGVLWLAKGKRLTQLRPNQSSELPLQIDLPDNAVGLALNLRNGVLWVATENKLISYGADGKIGVIVDLQANNLKNIRKIAFDPVTQSLWVSAKNALARFSAQGAFITSFLGKEADGDFSVPGFLMTPTLSLVRPAALTNNPTPTISYGYGALCNTMPCGFSPENYSHYSLAATLNQTSVGPFVFEQDTGQTSYTLISKPPEGPNTLVAQAKDGFGHLSPVTKDIFTLDTIPPKFLSLSPAEGSVTNAPATTIQGVVDDVMANILLNVVGASTSAASSPSSSGSFSFPVMLKEGLNTFDLTAWDRANNNSKAVLHITLDTTPPKFLNVTPATGAQFSTAQVTISGSVDDPTATVSLANLAQWNGTGANPSGQNFSWTLTLKPGANDFQIGATDQAGNIAVFTLTLTYTPPPPVVPVASKIIVGTVSNGSVTVTGSAGAVAGGLNVVVTNTRTQQTATVTATGAGAFSALIAAQAADVLAVNAVDQWGGASNPVQFPVASVVQIPPPSETPVDPVASATPIDPTVATSIASATAFLYTGPNAIQTGVAANTIETKRVAVLRGNVMTRDNLPLSGVTITVLNHPEFGQTLSRANGLFDIAANGGDYLTVNYAKDGYLPVQRTVQAPWQGYVMAPDVVMIPLDSRATVVTLNATAPLQVARANAVTDQDGTRQATMLFPQGTTATMTLANGTTQTLGSVTVRSTEFTVGENGPKAMPGPLPPTSLYTYAVENSIDEAIAAGATRVDFNQPVYHYIENFLQFPVGSIVPVGYYDRQKAAWIPSDNGVVIKILSIDGGVATVDSTGNGQADSALGITNSERMQLAALYASGTSLWRLPMKHFSVWDGNPPGGPGPNAVAPNVPTPIDISLDDPTCQAGSIIECQNQSLGESVPIAGTPFSLNYKSSRTRGASPLSTRITLSGGTLPASVKRIEVEVSVAGRQFKRSFPPSPNQFYDFVWDGLDAYGRPALGKRQVTVRIGYVYPGFYGFTQNKILAFGSFWDYLSEVAARQDWTLWSVSNTTLGDWLASTVGLGGWTLSVQHAYDPLALTFYQGDGRKQSGGANLKNPFLTVAGTGTPGFSGDGGPAVSASLNDPRGLAIDANGNLFIADTNNNRVRKVERNGVIRTVAGNGYKGSGGDGGQATLASVYAPRKIAIDAQGNLYISATRYPEGNPQIRMVSPSGIISTIAGAIYEPNYEGNLDSGDGGLATQAKLSGITDMKTDPQGNLYITTTTRLRKISTNGIITTIARGTGAPEAGNEGPASSAVIGYPKSLAIDPQGSLYIGAASSIRKITPDGIIHAFAGTSVRGGYSTESFPATTPIYSTTISGMAFGSGNLYFTSSYCQLRKVTPEGMSVLIAGGAGGEWNCTGYSADGNIPSKLYAIFASTVIDPIGSIYFIDNYRVRKLQNPWLGLSGNEAIVSASKDGSQLFNFDATGRHLSTTSSATLATLYSFTYNAHGYVTQITDGGGNITRVERDASDQPTAIVSADGLRTVLTLDANGNLASIVNPAGEATSMTYGNGGLLTTFTNPRNQTSNFTYDSNGRLVKDQNAAGGSWSLTRQNVSNSAHQVDMQSAEGRNIRYLTEALVSGDILRTNTQADGSTTVRLEKVDGTTQFTSADGTFLTSATGLDPRFGLQAPIATSSSIKVPGGLTFTTTATRAVTLSNAIDPTSLITQTDTTTINGSLFKTVYDANLRKYTYTTPLNRNSVLTIDPHHRPLSVQVSGIQPISYSYDARGRLIGVTQSNGTTTQSAAFSYTPQGWLASVKNAANQTESYQYDLAGRVTQKTLADGRVILVSYDADGNVTTITPPGRPAHAFAYNAVNLETDYTPPALGSQPVVTHYDYNLDKQPVKLTRPDGQTASFAYDAGGRLASLATSMGNISYGYASGGRITGITVPGGIDLAYEYDGFLPTRATLSGPVAGVIDTVYDNFFRPSRIGVNGSNVSLRYDADGLLIGAGDLTIARNATNGFVTGSTLGQILTSQSYDGFGQLASFTATRGATTLFKEQYIYNNVGQLTQKTVTAGGQINAYGYGYDTTGRLADVTRNGVVIDHFEYDANGNRTLAYGISASYDDQDRLVSFGGAMYDYTINGELQRIIAGGGTAAYEYDVFGNLAHVGLPNGGVLDYLIDGRGRRIGKKRNGVLTQGFLYQDQLKPAAELDGMGNVVSRFVYAGKANVPEYMVKSGVKYRVITDQLGSVRLVVDSATGQVMQQIEYDEWGNVLSDSNPGFQPFGFAGGLYDRDSGLVRFGARDYDPMTGRWTTKDPIGFGGGDSGLYSYVGGNPTSITDPSGKIVPVVVAAGVGAILGATSAIYGAAISGGSLTDMAIAGGIGFVGGGITGAAALVGGYGFLSAATLNFGVNAELNLVGQMIAYNNAPSCKKPTVNFPAAIGSGLGSMAGGAFGPFAGESLGALLGAGLVGLPADMAINAATSSTFPTQYHGQPR